MKHAPEEYDCPMPNASDIEAYDAEGGVGLSKADLGTGAMVRVVLLKPRDSGRGIDQSYNGLPIREGQVVDVFDADDIVQENLEDNTYLAKKKLASPWIESALRMPRAMDFQDGTGLGTPALRDTSIVEFNGGSAFANSYDCMQIEKCYWVNDATAQRCSKYRRLIDVFQFRAFLTGKVLGTATTTPPRGFFDRPEHAK